MARFHRFLCDCVGVFFFFAFFAIVWVSLFPLFPRGCLFFLFSASFSEAFATGSDVGLVRGSNVSVSPCLRERHFPIIGTTAIVAAKWGGVVEILDAADFWG
jgi:hypothetical protein